MGLTTIERTFNYEDVPTILRFSQDRDTFLRELIGPFGSGKSSGCCMELMDIAQKQKPMSDGVRRTRWAVVRNSYPQLNDTTIKTFQYWFPPRFTGFFRTTDHYQIINKITAPDGSPIEAEILFRALDKPEHVDNLLSLELTGAWFNELREIPKAIWDAMAGRVGRFPPEKDGGCTWSGIFADTNPPDSDHWAYKLFVEEQPWMCAICGFPFDKAAGMCTNPGHVMQGVPPCKSKKGKPATAVYHQPSGRGPYAENLPNLAPQYYAKLMAGKSPAFIKVYVDGEYGYVSDGRPVYENWSHVLHVAPEALKVNRNYPMIVTFDFGQGACILLQNLPQGNLNVIKEFYYEGGTIGVERLIRDIVKPYLFSNYLGMRFYVTGDPAGTSKSQVDERTCYMEIQKQRLTSRESVRPAYTNAWTPRFDAVDRYLTKWIQGKPAFQVDPSCKLLIKGFDGKYRFKRIQVASDERYQDKAEKNKYSHVHDALQYGCMFLDHGMEMMNTRIYYTPTPAPSPLAWT
jgi:hypothetical protein